MGTNTQVSFSSTVKPSAVQWERCCRQSRSIIQYTERVQNIGAKQTGARQATNTWTDVNELQVKLLWAGQATTAAARANSKGRKYEIHEERSQETWTRSLTPQREKSHPRTGTVTVTKTKRRTVWTCLTLRADFWCEGVPSSPESDFKQREHASRQGSVPRFVCS